MDQVENEATSYLTPLATLASSFVPATREVLQGKGIEEQLM
jgi:hypothetical protein